MDGDFQTHYLAAEQAYGDGDFQEARTIVQDLLNQLDPLPDDGPEREAMLAWQAFVALLAGNIHLYGLDQPQLARGYYELVLASNPQETLQELAEQGLERTREYQSLESEPVQASAPPEDPGADPEPPSVTSDLIADPFLHQSTDVVSSAQPGLNISATPWLTDEQQQRMADQAATGQINLGTALAPDGIAEPERAAESPWLKDEQQTSNPEAAAEPDAVAEPAPESTAALDATKEEAEADEASEPNEPRDDPATVEPDAEISQVSEPVAEAVAITSESPPDPGISDAVRQRLEAGMLLVELPDSQPTPSEDQSTSDKGSGRWSWLRSALGRS